MTLSTLSQNNPTSSVTTTPTIVPTIAPIMAPVISPAISPIIAVICCHKVVDDDHAQVVKDSYINAVYHFGGLPVLLPAVLAEDASSLDKLLTTFDGILLTGSYSNVAPHWYGGTHEEKHTDLGRDKLSFALIAHARKHNKPLLAICRGHQELNVAYGGVLHPDYRTAGFSETHLYPSDLPKDNEYQSIHSIWIDDSTLLGEFVTNTNQAIKDTGEDKAQWQVNSLHNQFISGLADGLQAMAIAPDGLIEAIYDPNHAFMVGVQWHPEGCVDDELSEFLFTKFIEASGKAVAYTDKKTTL